MRRVTKKKAVEVKQNAKPRKKRQSKYEQKVSLAPLTFDEAMSLAVKPKIK
ncbi:MAG: hypothetical protein SGJ05_12315 [bacterium]|nr:hypothetical protein [bacterium]